MNDVFLEACLLAEQDWIDSLDIPIEEHKFSPDFEKKMNKLIDKMRKDKYHRLTRKATRALIIAAIILSLAVTALAAPVTRNYIIKQFKTYSAYVLTDSYDDKITDDLTLGYIPEGFKLIYQDKAEFYDNREYIKDNRRFYILKTTLLDSIYFDTQKYKYEEFEYNNIKYIYYKSSNETTNIIWSNKKCIYRIGGNLSKEEIFKIAKHTK